MSESTTPPLPVFVFRPTDPISVNTMPQNNLRTKIKQKNNRRQTISPFMVCIGWVVCNVPTLRDGLGSHVHPPRFQTSPVGQCVNSSCAYPISSKKVDAFRACEEGHPIAVKAPIYQAGDE